MIINFKKSSFERVISAMLKAEPLFFYLLLFANTLPVLLFASFPTVDGSAHLYNVRLSLQLIANPDSPLSHFLMFNPHLNPNLLGHFILGLLMTFLPALLAEKVFLLSYLIFFPLSFRYLLKVLQVSDKYLIYFVFPFTYSFMFYYGFYNFHIGLVFLFLSLALWIRYLNAGLTIGRMLVLTLLSLLVFFSHLFVFGILLTALAAINLNDASILLSTNIDAKKQLLKRWLQQVLIFLPGIVLTGVYFATHPSGSGSSQYLSLNELLMMIKQVEPAKGVNYSKEDIFTKWIFILFAIFCIFHLSKFLIRPRRVIKADTLIWGSLTALLLLAYLFMPNLYKGTIGFVNSRLLIFFFLFLIVFLATLRRPGWLTIIAFVIINYVNIALINVYVQATATNNELAEQVIEASQIIEPYSTVYPIYQSKEWIFTNISNYLGIDKPLLITENIEASLNYFPLVWNRTQMPRLHLGNPQAGHEILPSNNPDQPRQIDYVFLFLDGSSADNQIDLLGTYPFLKQYDKVFEGQHHKVNLYTKKNSACRDARTCISGRASPDVHLQTYISRHTSLDVHLRTCITFTKKNRAD